MAGVDRTFVDVWFEQDILRIGYISVHASGNLTITVRPRVAAKLRPTGFLLDPFLLYAPLLISQAIFLLLR